MALRATGLVSGVTDVSTRGVSQGLRFSEEVERDIVSSF